MAKDYERAIALYEKLVTASPEDESFLLNLSSAYFYSGEFKKAEKILEHILGKNGQHPQALYNMGMVLLGLDNEKKAENYLRLAQTLSKQDPRPLFPLARHYAKKRDTKKLLLLFNDISSLLSSNEEKSFFNDPVFEAFKEHPELSKFLQDPEF